MANPKSRAALLAASVVLAGCMSSPAATQSQPTGAAEAGRFHHVHLNVSDIAATQAFYGKVFGATPTSYRGGPALMTDRAFLFLNQKTGPIRSALQTGLIHVGWSGVDGASEFAYWQAQGIEFYTPLQRVGAWEYFYLYGPDREVIEIWTQDRNHRFNHVHMLAADPKATAEWFAKATASEQPATSGGAAVPGVWRVDYGDVGIDILPDNVPAFRPKERTGAMQPTDGAGIDHVAFSFRDLDAALARVKAQGIPVEREISVDPTFGIRSFFLRAPNGVLVELVEAKPWPEAAWE